METRKIKILENEYEFVNETWETSNAWGHRSILLKNGFQLVENKVRYYNRTWESYRYQTCMCGCVWKLKKERETTLKERYKDINNITKITSKYKKDFDLYLKNDETMKVLNKLTKKLKWK